MKALDRLEKDIDEMLKRQYAPWTWGEVLRYLKKRIKELKNEA